MLCKYNISKQYDVTNVASHQNPSRLLTLELFSNLDTLIFPIKGKFNTLKVINWPMNMIMLMTSKYDLKFVQKNNTGHSDLYFMVK